jgi:hypothetical protein
MFSKVHLADPFTTEIARLVLPPHPATLACHA